MGRKRLYTEAESGEINRIESNARRRRQTEDVRDIGELPEIANPARRAGAANSLEVFCKTYLPWTFTLPFSQDHRDVIAKMELAIREGGLFAMAMPRGSGKTALSEAACLWSILYGYRQFVMLIGASADAATQMLESIKTELETNEVLAADFPESVYPIQLLEGEPRRCKGQTYHGERTVPRWSVDEIVMPTIPGSKSSGAIIRVAGITGRVRGQKFKRADGASARPDFVIVDDPQTDASAASQSQCVTRERTISGAILGLAGPGKKISGVMPCTVIRAGDVADRALDVKIFPEWNGSRKKLVYSMPINMEKWKEYRDILLNFNPAIPGDKERAGESATEFYLEHSSEMDAGAVVAWPERYEPQEMSAVQNAMNIFFRDPRAFAAEYQNEPLPEETDSSILLTADQIAKKVNGLKRGYVPVECTRITAGIDVQKTILFYVVAAWRDDYTGYIIDYGAFPDQKRPYFTLSQVDRTLAKEVGVPGLEAQIFAGVTQLTTQLLSRDWAHGGGALRIERAIVDAGYETDAVFAACRQSIFANVITPGHGRGIGATGTPMASWPLKIGERRGLNWVMPLSAKRDIRAVVFETNFWADFVFSRLAVPHGAPGCLSLFGDQSHVHRMFADHLAAEAFTVVEAKGRVVNEWKCKPNTDNHWFDCLRMAAVAASMAGVALPNVHDGARPAARVKFSEQQKAARKQRVG